MTVKFFIQSNRTMASIYVRVRDSKFIDAKANTGLIINKASFKKGEVKLFKIPSNGTIKQKKEVQDENKSLNELQNKLNELKSKIIYLINNREGDEIIDSNILKEVIKPKTNEVKLPKQLSLYFEKFIEFKKTTLKHSTIKKLGSIKSRIEKYEECKGTVNIKSVNNRFSQFFQLWCDEVGYDHNTKVKTLKVIKTVCNHAADNGLEVSHQLGTITKGLTYKKTEHIYLNFAELNKIIKTEMPTERLEKAKDWLIISCFTAQRVSDFLRFSKDKIIKMEGIDFLDISQEKTDKPVLIPLTSEVKFILDKRDGEFPGTFSSNSDSNKAIYNKLIKKVCELAKINYTVSAKLKNHKTKRYEEFKVPKYKAVSTHIGRRSFATNYYGKINTALLIAATGHASEQQFLRYVGKKSTQNALALAEAMRNIMYEDV